MLSEFLANDFSSTNFPLFQKQRYLLLDIIYRSTYPIYLMIEFVLGALLLIVIWGTYSCYYRPKQYTKRFARQLRDLGYSVYENPYQPFQISYGKYTRTDTQKHGDAYHTLKTVYSKVDIALQHVLNKSVLVLINPDLLKDFFTPEQIANYPKNNIIMQAIRFMLGEGMLYSEGAKWKHRRRLISNAFNFELLKNNIPKICNICDKKIYAIEEESKIKDGQFSYELMELGSSIFNGIVMACFFGQDQVKENINGQSFDSFIIRLMGDANKISLSPLTVLLGKKIFSFGGLTPKARDILRRINLFKDIAAEIIAKRREEVSKGIKSSNCSDIVQNLIKAQQKEKQQGRIQPQLSNYDLVEEFCIFVVAGTDTTAHFLTMMIYLIKQNPNVEKRLREDIEKVIKGQQDYNYDNLKKLTYIDWIQSETTRYYGPVNGLIFRQAAEDNFIGRVPVKKGTIVTIHPTGSHYNEQYFNNPKQFRPERWESECNNLKPYTLTGFGGGIRTCIGKQLAFLQSKIALIKLFKRYKKITLPKEKIIMKTTFLYEPQSFKTTFFRNQ